MKAYTRPPITEAVIGINFEAPLDEKELEKGNSKFLKQYPRHQLLQNVSLKVAVNQEGHANADGTRIAKGHRRTNDDVNELLVLRHSEFIVSQLAPYPGWDSFAKRFVRDWKIWKRLVGYRAISRVGVRFINRLDIPLKEGGIEHEKYLKVFPALPDIVPVVQAYAIQAQAPLDDIKSTLIINSAIVPAPILGHGSFLLDLDIGRTLDVPQSDEDMFDLLNQFRTKKNEVFEACISNHARRLFQK
jgi:uncharacterized protein (TIGR04255 family)